MQTLTAVNAMSVLLVNMATFVTKCVHNIAKTVFVRDRQETVMTVKLILLASNVTHAFLVSTVRYVTIYALKIVSVKDVNEIVGNAQTGV